KTVGLACIASAASSQTTISERVRLAKETPGTPVVMGVLGEPVRMAVEELTKRSAVVLEARLSWRTTYINAADTAVVTVFAILPIHVLAGRVPPANSTTPGRPAPFVLETYGGEIVKNGVTVRAVSHDLEPLKHDGLYLLFLKPF